MILFLMCNVLQSEDASKWIRVAMQAASDMTDARYLQISTTVHLLVLLIYKVVFYRII